MKLYVSVDMEGLWGVSTAEQVKKGNPNYEHARKLMSDEVNIITDLLFEQGAETIVINDSHGAMDNILIDRLDPRVTLIHGNDKPRSMMQGLDESFDGAFLIGYHARAGSEGVLAHTYASRLFQNIEINDKPYGESGLNAFYAGSYNVPIIGASGDDILASQIKEEIGDIPFNQVKIAHSFESATHRPKDDMERNYRMMIESALKSLDQYKALSLEGGVRAKITFKNPLHVLKVSNQPDTTQTSGDTVRVNAMNFETFYTQLLTFMDIIK